MALAVATWLYTDVPWSRAALTCGWLARLGVSIAAPGSYLVTALQLSFLSRQISEQILSSLVCLENSLYLRLCHLMLCVTPECT